ncbi:MAG: 3-hydroxyacyl-CoA dehydrogenase family protein [Chloroflexota bacterium]
MRLDDVKRITVIGGGVMGHGIAMTCARAGYRTTVVDIKQELLDNTKNLIENGPFGLRKQVEKGKMTAEQAQGILGNLNYTTDLAAAVGDVQFVIEAVTENVGVKAKVFANVEESAPGDAILASNTSGIMITELSRSLKRKDRMVGMHWFSPAQVMKLIEVVPGAETSEETLQVTMELSRKLGKVPVKANDGPGFYTTRFIANFLAEGVLLFEQGIADIPAIDEMTKLAFGFPMGPFELMDLIGLDTIFHIYEYLFEVTGDSKYKPPLALRKLYLAGYYGDKRTKPGSAGGWYDYYKIPRGG